MAPNEIERMALDKIERVALDKIERVVLDETKREKNMLHSLWKEVNFTEELVSGKEVVRDGGR